MKKKMFVIKWKENGKHEWEITFTVVGLAGVMENLVEMAKNGVSIEDIVVEEIEEEVEK